MMFLDGVLYENTMMYKHGTRIASYSAGGPARGRQRGTRGPRRAEQAYHPGAGPPWGPGEVISREYVLVNFFRQFALSEHVDQHQRRCPLCQ